MRENAVFNQLVGQVFYGVRVFYARFTYFIKVIKKFCFSSDGNNRSSADVQEYEGCVVCVQKVHNCVQNVHNYVQKVHNYSQSFEIFVCEK